MNRYRIEYRSECPGCPVFCMTLRAYSAEHAEERFWDSDSGDDGWVILSIRKVTP